MHDLVRLRLDLQRALARLDCAEQELKQLRRRREPTVEASLQVYWCQTCDPTSGSYPTPPATVFPIKFLDCYFTATAGDQTQQADARSTGQVTLGFADQYIPKNTILRAVRSRGLGPAGSGEWWLFEPRKIFLGKSNGTLPQDDFGNVHRYDGDTLTPTGDDDLVWNVWPAVIDNKWVAYTIIDGFYYSIAPSGGSTTTTDEGIDFVNNSGEDIPAHAVMAPASNVISGGVSYVAVEKPGLSFYRHWLINGSSTIANDATGKGFWRHEKSGPVLIDDGAQLFLQTGHEFGPSPGSWGLKSCRLGFECLSDIGNAYALDGVTVADFKQRYVDRVLGKFYSQLNQGSEALFEIWFRGDGGTVAPSGWDKITVKDWWLNKGEKVLAGTRGAADWSSGYWEADAACDVDNTSSSQQSPGANQAQPVNQQLQPQQLVASPTSGSTGIGTGTF